MRRLVIAFTVIGLVWANSVGATARQDGLSVVPSEASTGSELAGLFPLSVGGQPVAVETWSGPEWVARLDPGVPGDAAAITATGSLLVAVGTTLDDLQVASASLDLGKDGEVTIAAVRVPGSRAYDFVDAAVGFLLPPAADPSLGWGWAGDAWIAYHVDRAAHDDDPVVVYPAADTIWVIAAQARGHRPIEPWVEPILEALPPQSALIGPIVPLPQRVEVPGLGVAASFPEDWTVETVPVTAEAQTSIDRAITRFGIEAEWMGAVSAIGPADPELHAAPACRLEVFGQTEVTPRAWIAAATEGNRCYLIDETPAGLVRARIAPGDCGREWAPSQGGTEHFALGRGDEVVLLNCWTKEPPGERGSAIAQAIEFLPAEG